MFKECEKIADLRKKIQVDPPNTRTYEAAIWRHYSRVTEHNDAYYEEKNRIEPKIRDAHIIFKSMEGQKRALRAYDINIIVRAVVSHCFCLDNFFKKKRLLNKGNITVVTTVDPEIILWENLGVHLHQKCCNWLLVMLVMLLIFIVNFWGQVYFQLVEKSMIDVIKSDCQGEDYYNIDNVLADYKRPEKYMLGEMHCYCKAMYQDYGMPGLKILFADGEQYCKEWYETIF